jgi:beta-glucosidase-like glycosyl hydrolase
MVSYSSVNGIPMSLGPSLGNILRKQLKFDGLVISDYD